MLRKLVSLSLALCLLCSAALAQELPLAAGYPDLTALTRYAAWQEDENGQWSVHSNETAAALYQLGSEQQAQAAYFCLALSGDREEGIIQPELVFYYTGYTGYLPVNPDTASVAADGIRYDFACVTDTAEMGRVTCQVLRAPLDRAGLDAVRRIASAEKVSVRLTGTGSYTFTPELKDTYASTKAQVEASSLKGMTAMLDELDALDIADYDLWDLNKARWTRLYGEKYGMERAELDGEPVADNITLSEAFGMLSAGDNGQSVRALQELLMEKGYMQFRTADGSFGEGTIRAVKAARRYLGMMECGIADAAFIRALQTGKAYDAAEASLPEKTAVGETCAVSLDKYWFARAVSSEKGDLRTADNGDDLLLIVSGRIENTTAAELTMYRQVTAALTLGEVEIPCTVEVVLDRGARFDAFLPALSEAPMVIYAEIPARAAEMEGWTLALTAGEETVEYTLSGGN